MLQIDKAWKTMEVSQLCVNIIMISKIYFNAECYEAHFDECNIMQNSHKNPYHMDA